jgi:hypothetical protein
MFSGWASVGSGGDDNAAAATSVGSGGGVGGHSSWAGGAVAAMVMGRVESFDSSIPTSFRRAKRYFPITDYVGPTSLRRDTHSVLRLHNGVRWAMLVENILMEKEEHQASDQKQQATNGPKRLIAATISASCPCPSNQRR